jgi:hypothetical protein
MNFTQRCRPVFPRFVRGGCRNGAHVLLDEVVDSSAEVATDD